ncbi:hypothetical protein [Azospirillum soli]|uniref:hypothetical protein n=1 Tax=Azospirillum soli TaxID=1304799 RepID=UPI001AE8BA7F|nr:hypothetical protein [Azospirillum soli]MBP2315377.1 hypothetical protein [Azospirillum soli]
MRGPAAQPVTPDLGPYAFPYYGYDYGFEPGQDYYGLPYDSADVGTSSRFDANRMDTAVIGSGRPSRQPRPPCRTRLFA